jgi:arabinan endo-1,5-alpha-L-arabinosidase
MKHTLPKLNILILCFLLVFPFLNSCKKESNLTAVPVVPTDTKVTTNTGTNISTDFNTNIPIIDPCIIRQNGTFHLFGTGGGLAEWTSNDMKDWKQEKSVFNKIPTWIYKELPEFAGDLWAPDISYFNGKYYLFYCASLMGQNQSVIGVATNTTLDRADANYQWVDHGLLFKSYQNVSKWNALDPNLSLDDQGNPYLAFGSFWQGIKIVKLNPDGLSVAEDPDSAPIIGSRNSAFATRTYESGPTNNAIEGAFIYKKNGYYYLFASNDYCCRAGNSNYKIVVGRSKSINADYVGQDGRFAKVTTPGQLLGIMRFAILTVPITWFILVTIPMIITGKSYG